MKKVLLTGANGFVGKNLVELLKEKYWIVGSGTSENPRSDVHQYIKWDISKEIQEVPDILAECECIIHAAACIEQNDFCKAMVDVNCVGTYQVAELARKLECKKIIYISSVPVIGFPHKDIILEEDNPSPVTMYHATKLAGEHILRQLERYGTEVFVLRIPSPIGKHMVTNTIFPIFLNRALNNEQITIVGKGTRKQNYIDLRDLAQVIDNCIKLDVKSGCYNIASAKSISNLDLAKLCVELLQSSSEICFTNTKDPLEGIEWNISIEKARRELKYSPRFEVEQMIQYYGSKESTNE